MRGGTACGIAFRWTGRRRIDERLIDWCRRGRASVPCRGEAAGAWPSVGFSRATPHRSGTAVHRPHRGARGPGGAVPEQKQADVGAVVETEREWQWATSWSRAQRLPGIGWRYSVPTASNGRLMIVVEDRGPRHLLIVDPSLDAPLVAVRMSETDAGVVAALLAGVRFALKVPEDERGRAPEEAVVWVLTGSRAQLSGGQPSPRGGTAGSARARRHPARRDLPERVLEPGEAEGNRPAAQGWGQARDRQGAVHSWSLLARSSESSCRYRERLRDCDSGWTWKRGLALTCIRPSPGHPILPSGIRRRERDVLPHRRLPCPHQVGSRHLGPCSGHGRGAQPARCAHVPLEQIEPPSQQPAAHLRERKPRPSQLRLRSH